MNVKGFLADVGTARDVGDACLRVSFLEKESDGRLDDQITPIERLTGLVFMKSPRCPFLLEDITDFRQRFAPLDLLLPNPHDPIQMRP